MKKENIIINIALFLLLIITRLIPHISNFSPVFAIGLFGYNLHKNHFYSLIIPLFGMFITDIFIGFYSNVWAVYLSVIISITISNLLSLSNSKMTMLTRAFSAPTLFFVLSNLSVYFIWYPLTLEGFIQCYVNAIPFYGYSLISTYLYYFTFHYIYKFAFKKDLLPTNS